MQDIAEKTSSYYYALEAQKIGPSEAFHKRLLTLNREEIDADNMIKCCNPIAIRKNLSQHNGWTKICFWKFGLLQKFYDLRILRAKKSNVMCSISLVCICLTHVYRKTTSIMAHEKQKLFKGTGPG